ncbi:MAG: PAS domain-containing protein [Candidatus Delongbacteria bacterium]|jgi:PAS domain S-box-containing protein|nr:PAS domain-containing protein [Candidatus Delongbacteria bacterium]
MSNKVKKHTANEIKQALTYIEIFKPEDEIDCKGCGYDTCKEFAQAMLNGETRPSQCVVLSKKIIDKLKRKEKLLRENIFFHQEIIDSIPVPIVYEEPHGTILGCNKAFEELLGSSKEKIKFTKIDHYTSNEKFIEVLKSMNKSLLKNPGKQIVEIDLNTSGNEARTIEFHRSTFSSRVGEINGFVSAFFDIDDRENQRKELEKAKELSELSSKLLKLMPSGFVIVDKDLKVIDSNKSFVEMIGDDAKLINEINPGLKGAALSKLLSFSELFSQLLESGEKTFSKDVIIGNKLFKVSLFLIQKNTIVGAIIKDLTDPEVNTTEIVERAEMVIKENLDTVQQIAYLLGENASKTENVLSSIINIYKSKNE